MNPTKEKEESRMAAMLASAGVTGLKLTELLRQTTDSVMGVLRKEIQHGRWQEVLAVLKGNPQTQAGRTLYNVAKNVIIDKLVLRLGLRRIFALAIAVVLLPFILRKIYDEVKKRGASAGLFTE